MSIVMSRGQSIYLPVSHQRSFLDSNRNAALDEPASDERDDEQPWYQNSDKDELRQVMFHPGDDCSDAVLEPSHSHSHFRVTFVVVRIVDVPIFIRIVLVFSLYSPQLVGPCAAGAGSGGHRGEARRGYVRSKHSFHSSAPARYLE